MSKNSGIGHVWAANVGEDGRPNGVGPVWIENISAIGGGGGGSIPSEVSGKWEDASNCVESNSASWAGGTSLTGDAQGAVDKVYAYSGKMENAITKNDGFNQAITSTNGRKVEFGVGGWPGISVYRSNGVNTTSAHFTSNEIRFRDKRNGVEVVQTLNLDDINNLKSASAGGGSSELSSKLDASAVGFRTYYGQTYVSGISGKQVSARYAYSADNAGNAVESQYALTAYYDENGNNVTAGKDAWNTVNANSANWAGGGGGEGSLPNLLFYYNYVWHDVSNSQITNIDTKPAQIKFVVEHPGQQPNDVTIDGNTYSFVTDDNIKWYINATLNGGSYVLIKSTFQDAVDNEQDGVSAVIGDVSAKVNTENDSTEGWKFYGISGMDFTSVNNETNLIIRDDNYNTITSFNNTTYKGTGYSAYTTYIDVTDINSPWGTYSATFPQPAAQVPLEIVSNSAAATGTNILYVVTGSSN